MFTFFFFFEKIHKGERKAILYLDFQKAFKNMSYLQPRGGDGVGSWEGDTRERGHMYTND